MHNYNLLLPEDNVCFQLTNKAGSTSMKHMLAQHLGLGADFIADPTTELEAVDQWEIPVHYKVCFVHRHPEKRVVSFYNQHVKGKVAFDVERSFPDLFTPDMTLTQCVAAICTVPDHEAHSHFKAQSPCIGLGVDVYHDIDTSDWNETRKKLGVAFPPLPHMKRSEEDVVLSPWCRRMLRSRFEEDYRIFGYA